MLKIIPDTNTLLGMNQFNLNLFSELERVCNFKYKIYTLSNIIEELEKLINKGKLPEKKAASFALRLIKTKGIKVIKTDLKHVDDSLCKLNPKEFIVITQDKKLKLRLKEKGIKIIIIRQKNHLEWETKNVL
ncbi:MAG: hypothetical protein ABIF40_01885 [archaeon]